MRTSKTVGGTTTPFTWTPGASTPLLLSDGTENYIYGPTGAPVEQTGAAGASPQWYFADAQRSTAALTDLTGAIVGTYSYTIHGAIATHSGSASSPIEFAGEYADAETGFVYLRARYYDPGTALFLSSDPALASTAFAFVYASNNPLDMFDPLGLFGIGWWAGTIGSALGIAGLVLDATGVAAPVGAVLEVLSLAAGGVAIAADCGGAFGERDAIGCGFDVAGEVTGGVGLVAGRAASIAEKGAKAAEESLKAAQAAGTGVKAARAALNSAKTASMLAKSKLIGVDVVGVMYGGYGTLLGTISALHEQAAYCRSLG